MSVSNFNLRGIPSEIMEILKREAQRSHTSINTLVLQMLERGLGFTQKTPEFHDLDYLAGSWTSVDEKIFRDNTQSFEEIDKELWK